MYEILSSWEAKLGEGAGQGKESSMEELEPISTGLGYLHPPCLGCRGSRDDLPTSSLQQKQRQHNN